MHVLILSAFLGCVPGSAADAWAAVRDSAPCPGVTDSGEWCFSCVRRARDPDVDETMDRRQAEQDALEHMLGSRVGRPELPGAVPARVRALLEPLMEESARSAVSGAGLQSFPAGGDVPHGTLAIVVALPKAALDAGRVPLDTWVQQVASRSGAVPVPEACAALEVATGPAERSFQDRFAGFLRSVSALPVGKWFPGWLVHDPARGSAAPEELRMAVDLCAARPGDPVLLQVLADSCRQAGCAKAAAMVDAVRQSVVSPRALVRAPGIDWTVAAVDGLAAPLVAIVRSGGALPARPGAPSAKLAAAVDFFERGRLEAAERRALQCAAASVDLDALNLASAAIVRDPGRRDADRARVALALAWEAYQLDPAHQYALGNVLLAMRALDMREEADTLLKANDCSDPSPWIRQQMTSVKGWLAEPSSPSPSAP